MRKIAEAVGEGFAELKADTELRLRKHQDVPLLLLRCGLGVIMVAHGTLKISDPLGTVQYFADLGLPLPVVGVALAILAEFFGGIGLILGTFTRLAALGTLSMMLVAIGAVHLGNGLFAANGGYEYPVILALVAMVFVVRGAGSYSLDAWVTHIRASRAGAAGSVRTAEERASA